MSLLLWLMVNLLFNEFLIGNKCYIFFVVFSIILTDKCLLNAQELPFDTLVSFGENNTDTGNVYNLTNHQWPIVPPYYKGRSTNGPVWIEKLNISTIINYAYIGATLDNEDLVAGYTQPNQTLVPGVRQQIQIYLTDYDLTSVNLARTVYVIWGGANDYLNNMSLTADIVVATVMDAVDDLVPNAVQNLLVTNLPPFQFDPAFSNSTDFAILNQKIIDHNNYLLANITQFKLINNLKNLYLFDLYSLITNILSNKSTINLNKINKCWTLLSNNTILQCSNPDNYIFIDDYHLTTTIHQLIANHFSQFLLSLSSSSACNLSLSKFFVFIYIINRIIYSYFS